MYCTKCGNMINEDEKFCPVCGNNKSLETEVVKPESNPTHDKFAKLGFTFGLVSLLTSFLLIGVDFAILGLIFSSIGKKSVEFNQKAKTGVTLSIIGLVIGIILSFGIGILIGILGEM